MIRTAVNKLVSKLNIKRRSMKKLLIIPLCAFFFACDSAQKGNINYTDSADQKMDTTTVPVTSANSDSTRPDSTVKDSIYHK
jgi:uncharacterized lipoprotein YajG